MEEFIKSFQPGFLLRSFFSGVFFPIFYYLFSNTPPPYFYIGIQREDLGVLAIVSLIADVTTYALHRFIIYPWIEWDLDYWHPKLISKRTLDRIQRCWETSQVESKLSTWGDFAHKQYCTAWCIGFAAVAAKLLATYPTVRDNRPFLLWGILIFWGAGFISDCRLRTVRDRFYPPPGTVVVGPTIIGPPSKVKSPPKTKIPGETDS
jgi:hypothetical protein